MSEVTRVTFKPPVVKYFAFCLTRSLKGRGQTDKQIQEITPDEVLKLFNGDLTLADEAKTLSSNPENVTEGQEAFSLGSVPNFWLVEQTLNHLKSGGSITTPASTSTDSKKPKKEKKQVAV